MTGKLEMIGPEYDRDKSQTKFRILLRRHRIMRQQCLHIAKAYNEMEREGFDVAKVVDAYCSAIVQRFDRRFPSSQLSVAQS